MPDSDRQFTQGDGWTLRDLCMAEDRVLQTEIDSICKMIDESRRLMEIRLAEMNRMREQLDKQAETFITKEMYLGAHQRLIEAVDKIESWKDKQEGAATQKSVWVAYAVSAAGLVIGIVGLLHSFGV